jgi:hypothetical protein
MTATAGLLSQVQEHLRMQDPLIGSRSQASTDPGNDAIDASPVTQKMENAIGIAFGVDVPPEPCLDSNASSGREEEVLNWGEFLKKYPEKSNREIGGAKSRNSQEEVVESEAIDLKKVKKTQGSPRTSGHKRIRDLMRDLSLKASGEIAISPDSSEGKASASVPTNSANESKPPFSFLADRPIIWKSKSAIVNGSTLLPMTGQTRLSVDELDEEIKTMLDYFINPFRLTGDLSSFLGGSSGTPRTTKDIAAIQWVNENSLIATMRITSNELSREANFPGKKLEQLLATIFRESSFATAALEAAMSHYGKKYAEGLLKPAWQKLEAVFRLRASKRTSLSIDSKNLNNDSTPGKVQDIQDIVQSIIESMIGVQTGKTDHATAKAGIHAASQAVPDKICMLLSGVTRQVAECAIDMLEKSELNKSLHLTPEELAARKNAIDAQARASIPTALLMLRLIGPAVVNKAVDLIPDHQRVLVLISKILQSIGNGASRQNDPVTSLFSTFIEKCQLPMQEFFAALLVRGDNLFTEIRVSMDLSAVSAEKRPAARSFAARMNAMIPKAIELIPASHLNSRLSDEEVLAGLLKILLLPDEPMAKQSMQPAPALTGQPQPGSGRSSPTLSPASAQQNSVSE